MLSIEYWVAYGTTIEPAENNADDLQYLIFLNISLRFSFVSSHLIHMEPAATTGPTKLQLARRLAGQGYL
jgi:hypothetical protein